ncbi:MAG TPA: nitronate monooxygenase [Thermoleophilaceae bacterium]|jgi:nitronate monooxygenase
MTARVILDQLEHPIVQAPMAGGPSTPALTAAVSKAGGLGFVAAGYLSARKFAERLVAVREVTDAPFGTNLFVPGSPEVDEAALRAYVEELGPGAGQPRFDDDDWDHKLGLLRDEPVAVVSFTFGCPGPDLLASLKDVGSEVWITVTSLDEARSARDAGADALVLQGVEAGGHRGTFDDPPDGGEGLSTLALLRIVATSDVELPLVPTGGIADAPGVAAALVAGAAAVQLGSAFMHCPEAATNPVHRAALGSERPTALTRAFSGRLARGIQNQFMRDHDAAAPRAYPYVHHATSPLRAVARERGDADGFNLWAGQAHTLARHLPAADVVRELSGGARAALAEAAARFAREADFRS